MEKQDVLAYVNAAARARAPRMRRGAAALAGMPYAVENRFVIEGLTTLVGSSVAVHGHGARLKKANL